MRKKFTTSIDEDLMTELKILALREKLNVNDILEDIIKQLINNEICLSIKK